MIAFDLRCHNGHEFEGWFDDGDAFESQCLQQLVACPICQSTRIIRAPSTFGIKKGSPTPNLPDLQKLNRKITQFVEQNFDNVGADFAQEALKIHYGVAEPRNIRGVSTAAEEKTLKDEGIDFVKVPLPVSDSNTDSNPDA